MKKSLLTSSILATFTLLSANSALANTLPSTSPNNTVDADEYIQVTANRTQQESFTVLSATEIIGEEDIKVLQPQSVTDLLDKVAGITVTNNGGAGQNSSVSMRGTSSGHTLVLVDGVRVGSATLGQTSFGSMSIAQIERIEIVKGPRAALWGSDAIGGVIQIFTKQFAAGEGVVSAGFGSNGLWKTDGSIGLGNEQHQLTLSVATEASDGFSAQRKTEGDFETDEDGYDRLSFGLAGKSIVSEEFSLHLAGRWEQGGAEYDPKYGSDGANENEHENYYLRIAGQHQTGDFFTEFSLATSQDQASTFDNDVQDSEISEIKTQRQQLSLLSQYTFSKQTSVTAGIDWYSEEVSHNNDLVGWVSGFQTYVDDSRDVSAVFVQARHEIDALLFEGAVRFDDVENVDQETTYNASIGYQLTDSWLVSYSHATAFKAPSFNDLYWPDSGNAELVPEHVTSNEILLRNQFENGSIEVSIYNSDIENLIAWAPIAPGSYIWKPANINQADIKGIELTLNADIGDLSHQFALSYLDAQDSEKNVQLARRPELTANYTMGYHWEEFTFHGILSYRDESPEDTAKDSSMLDAYWLVDASLSYQANSDLVITGKINNLFDESYETAENYIADGTNFILTASYSF